MDHAVKVSTPQPVSPEAMQVVSWWLAGLSVSRDLVAEPASVLLAVALVSR